MLVASLGVIVETGRVVTDGRRSPMVVKAGIDGVFVSVVTVVRIVSKVWSKLIV